MPTDPSFRMPIMDVFSIKQDWGIVVAGRVESGMLKVGDEVFLKGQSGIKKAVVTGLDAIHKQITQAQTGDNVSVLLKGVDRSEIRQGDVMSGNDAD